MTRVLSLLLCLVLSSTAWAQSSTAPAAGGFGAAPGNPGMTAPGGVSGPGEGGGIPTITNRAVQSTVTPPAGAQSQGPLGAPAAARATVAPQQPAAATTPLERNEFQDLIAQSLGRDLPMFGYNLFQSVPTTFAPLDGVPVTPDYVVGPGDEIFVRAWGQVDIDYRVIVDRSGAISIPRVGNIPVAGIRYQDLQGYLKTAIGRVFRNFDLNVSMGQLRSIQVFIVGHAARPGAYTVSSLSTLVNALFASGGPTQKGSMRRIQLKRGDKLVVEFDVYDLLLRGDKSKDAQLLPGDVIYIPPIGQLAAVSGSVNNPAIYELRGAGTIEGLIELAGGLTVTAGGQMVSVERISDQKMRTVQQFPVDKAGLSQPLRSGDLVQVLGVSPRFENAVTIRGNVAAPARHPWRAGMRVRDVIPDRASLITPDYWLKRNALIRPDPTLRQVDAGDRQRTDVRDQQRVRNDIKQTLSEVNWDYAVIERLNAADLTTTLVPFNLGKAILEGDEQQNLPLQPGDVLTVFSKDDIQVPVARQTKFVKLEGEFGAPGVYQALPGETLRQLVARVGGVSKNAYLFGATFTRESTRISQQKRLEEVVDRLEQAIYRNMSQTGLSKEEGDIQRAAGQGQLAMAERLRKVRATGRIVLEVSSAESRARELPDLALEDGDTLMVPARPSTVAVVGTVYNENAFLFRPDRRASDYLSQAGGPTKDADTDSLYVIRADGTVISQRQGGFLGFGGIGSGSLNAGDTIVVPEKLDKYRFTRELKDWSQIFYQFALGVAGLKVLKDL
jgi:polysaccharide export outer membrane protein